METTNSLKTDEIQTDNKPELVDERFGLNMSVVGNSVKKAFKVLAVSVKHINLKCKRINF